MAASKALTELRTQAGLDLEAATQTARETAARIDDWTQRQKARLAEMARRKQESQPPRRPSRDGFPVVPGGRR